jgi:hypothetical protein
VIAMLSKRSRTVRPVLTFVLTLVGANIALGAQTSTPPTDPVPPDALFVSTDVTDIAAGPRGITGAVEWLHPQSTTRSLNLGVVSFSLGDDTWTYGRVGTMWRRARTAVHAQIDVGAGREGPEQFRYLAARGTLTRQMADGRMALEVQDQYVDIHETTGNIVKVGLTLVPTRPLAVTAALHSSTGGDLDVRSMSVRIDGQCRGATVFSGLSIGRSRPALVGLPGSGPTQKTHEIYVGSKIRLKPLYLTVVVESLALAQTRTHVLSMSWTVPLPSNRSSRPITPRDTNN